MEPPRSQDNGLSYRALAILRAVAMGRVEITYSCELDLYIDGLVCSDQYTAHLLAHRKLITPSRPGRLGQRVSACLTATGQVALGAVPEAV